MGENLNNQIKNATKWSAITEIIAKLVTPISSMVLARLLTPEVFGVIAVLTMIISFAEIFTDAGFQKYLIQHEFSDSEDREQSTNVAFWSNLVMSLAIWGVIAVFCEPLAKLCGSPGLGIAITVACVSIPLAAFSSIQMALYKRDFDFKTLFKVRIASSLVPFVVTIPLAIIFRNYWALLIGIIAKDLINAVLLTIYSRWKPKFYYSWRKLKEMLSFSFWSIFEQISIWLTGYLDVFIVGVVLSSYYLGIYRTATATVGQITSLITGATIPVLFSALSRLQNNRGDFEQTFLKFQKWVGLLVLPLGVGIYCYQDLLVAIMLGEQWKEAAPFVGLWGLTSAITIVFSHYCSEIYRAIGKPKLSVLVQWLHIVVLLPLVYWASSKGYEILYITRSLVRFEAIFVNLLVTYCVIKLSPFKLLREVVPELLACVFILGCFYLGRLISTTVLCDVISAIIAAIGYFAIVCLFKSEREGLLLFSKQIINKIIG